MKLDTIRDVTLERLPFTGAQRLLPGNADVSHRVRGAPNLGNSVYVKGYGMTFLCDFCGATDFRWFFKLSDGTGVQVSCDICLRLIQADDPTRLVQRTTHA